MTVFFGGVLETLGMGKFGSKRGGNGTYTLCLHIRLFWYLPSIAEAIGFVFLGSFWFAHDRPYRHYS